MFLKKRKQRKKGLTDDVECGFLRVFEKSYLEKKKITEFEFFC